MSNKDIPWEMSDVGPYRLTTLKDMTPEQQEFARSEALRWTELGLSRRNKCSRCAFDYEEPSPGCINKLDHAISEIAEGLLARDQAILSDIEKGSSKIIDEVVEGLDKKVA